MLSPRLEPPLGLMGQAPAEDHMLTIFSTPKPFRGHIGTIQRNAIGSWVCLDPGCEVILFGDDPGCTEIAKELRLRQEPNIRRNESGTPLLDSVFARGQEIAAHDVLCYVNCDIMLLHCFCEAVLRVARSFPKFLIVGRRWDTTVIQPLDFKAADWESELRALAMRSGREQLSYAVDYFVFPRGLYRYVPPFAIGRLYWDHWLVWRARSMRVPVVDAGAGVFAVHQNHDFSHQPEGLEGIRTGAEARNNRALAGGQLHLYTIDHATHQLVDSQIVNKPGHWHVPLTFLLRVYSSQFWYRLLEATFRARHAFGLYRGAFDQIQKRVRSFIWE
jgi:hypothetical protein